MNTITTAMLLPERATSGTIFSDDTGNGPTTIMARCYTFLGSFTISNTELAKAK
jgi:hypothetical protein